MPVRTKGSGATGNKRASVTVAASKGRATEARATDSRQECRTEALAGAMQAAEAEPAERTAARRVAIALGIAKYPKDQIQLTAAPSVDLRVE
jgi:hypothetical protein